MALANPVQWIITGIILLMIFIIVFVLVMIPLLARALGRARKEYEDAKKGVQS